jgi:two-component system sensor histidine kinase/response regulator
VIKQQPAYPNLRNACMRILLAEDNPYDALLLKEAFRAENLEVELDCVTDGEQLLTRLLGLGRDGRSSYDLVVLDSHLPRRSAEDVLSILESQSKRISVPVVVLTSLISDQSKSRLLELGVSNVFSKPLELNEYFALVRQLNSILGKGAR